SARIKMDSAGLSFADHPAASADDAHDRESIIRFSMQRAVERYGAPFVSTVFVGDGIWDARACRTLGIPFIGIGSGERAARLALEGAVRVFPDYSDTDLFVESLDEITQAVSQIAAANAGWRLQFRFAVHVIWARVPELWTLDAE